MITHQVRPLRVLFATDGSGPATTAIEMLLDLLRPTDVDLDVLCVVPTSAGLHELGPAERDASAAAARTITEDACWTARGAGASAVAQVREGHPAEVIVATAHSMQPDLVLVGSRGVDIHGQGIAGTVAAKVARYSPAPTLVACGRTPIRRAVLGYDGSAGAEQAIEVLAALPLRRPLTVTVVAVLEEPAALVTDPLSSDGPGAKPQSGDGRRHAHALARAAAARGAGRLARPGLTVSFQVREGEAQRELALAAADPPSDLIVIGSRGLSSIRAFALGSTSAALLASPPTSILIARSPGVSERTP